MSIDSLFSITEEDIVRVNERMIEYGKIKNENPKGYYLIREGIKRRLKSRFGIEITDEDIIEANKKFIEKYKSQK